MTNTIREAVVSNEGAIFYIDVENKKLVDLGEDSLQARAKVDYVNMSLINTADTIEYYTRRDYILVKEEK